MSSYRVSQISRGLVIDLGLDDEASRVGIGRRDGHEGGDGDDAEGDVLLVQRPVLKDRSAHAIRHN